MKEGIADSSQHIQVKKKWQPTYSKATLAILPDFGAIFNLNKKEIRFIDLQALDTSSNPRLRRSFLLQHYVR
jgi:hypothetical protein